MRKAMSSKEVIVWISLGSEDIRVGKLWFHVKGHKESTSFEYDKKWLDHPERFALEPALKLTEGSFHTGQGLSLSRESSAFMPERMSRTRFAIPVVIL
jgi:serine/threonine-protein kinase HipA